ncbi:MAG: 4Fe-4S binding protein [Anaerolineales bacterium]|jgi:2-oxoglutarate ferredoxin oxidoreductase subunit delta
MSYWRQPLDQDRIQISFGIVHVIEERCKGCGICVEFCPKKVLAISKQSNSKGYFPPKIENDNCINCGLCTLLCPDFAIYVEDGGLRPPDMVVSIVRNESN